MVGIHEAPELIVERWFNTRAPISLSSLRGRVVIIYAFQLLCPACVEHGIPQARRAHARFASERLQVLGLHTVFENHEAMSASVLEAFIAQHDLRFPIAIDAASASSRVPETMRRYDMQGTPTLVLVDENGRRRYQQLGVVSDEQLEALVGALLVEAARRSGP